MDLYGEKKPFQGSLLFSMISGKRMLTEDFMVDFPEGQGLRD
jgi:hypothetical protein